MSGNSLSMILTKNQLVGENYNDWKRNLMIVLTTEKYKFVLTEPCPAKSIVESTAEQMEAYDKWIQSDEMARCYILGSISNVLQQNHQNMGTAIEIMESLRATIDNPCLYTKCLRVKNLFLHSSKCEHRVAGGCNQCKKI